MWQKCIITFVCNVIGVWIVKSIEEKMQKDKLWEVRATVHYNDTKLLAETLSKAGIPHNYIENVGKYSIFNCYCSTQKESLTVKEILKEFDAKYFVGESKTL
jgi:hypothetical protein